MLATEVACEGEGGMLVQRPGSVGRREAAIIRSNHVRMFNYPEDAPSCHLHWIAEAEGNPIRSR